MRVKFLRDHPGDKGEQSYDKGAVVELDDGVAQQLITAGTVKDFPRTQAELNEALTKYYPGDENRTPKQIAERHAQAPVLLTGDTRADTEEQLGEGDPHEVRKDLLATAEKAAEKADNKEKADQSAADKAAAAKTAEEQAAAEKAKADEAARVRAKAGTSRG